MSCHGLWVEFLLKTDSGYPTEKEGKQGNERSRSLAFFLPLVLKSQLNHFGPPGRRDCPGPSPDVTVSSGRPGYFFERTRILRPHGIMLTKHFIGLVWVETKPYVGSHPNVGLTRHTRGQPERSSRVAGSNAKRKNSSFNFSYESQLVTVTYF